MSAIVTNLSQFKKAMMKGVNFKVINHFTFPERIGDIRKPNVVQSNGMYTIITNDINQPEAKEKFNTANGGKGSWIEFGAARCYDFKDGVITQYSDDSKRWPIWSIKLLG